MILIKKYFCYNFSNSIHSEDYQSQIIYDTVKFSDSSEDTIEKLSNNENMESVKDKLKHNKTKQPKLFEAQGVKIDSFPKKANEFIKHFDHYMLIVGENSWNSLQNQIFSTKEIILGEMVMINDILTMIAKSEKDSKDIILEVKNKWHKCAIEQVDRYFDSN